MSKNILAITTTSEELDEDITNGNLMMIDATDRIVSNDYIDHKYEPSGIILLGFVMMDINYEEIIEWNKVHYK